MTRHLEFIFYGLACFDPQPYGYRVLFPDGRDPAPYPVPAHFCTISVREQDQVVAARWPGPIFLNNFIVPDRNQLQITGLSRTPLNDTDLRGRLSNLKDSDARFEIDANPDAMYDLIVDRGILSAHQQSADGMIVVRWQVEAQDDAVVRLNYGPYWIELTPATVQVILANTGESLNLDEENTDFLLFRKLARDKNGPLPFVEPATMPLAATNVIHPIDELKLTCPGKDCSCVVSHA